jgi:osmotically inducible protein OsmC
MPHIERTAHVGWDGNLARGAGTLDGDSGAIAQLPFSLPSRVGEPGGKTSPEELLAAAHGGCITMSLVGELTAAGMPPGRLDTAVTIVMDEVEGQGHQIVGSQVQIVALVDGLDDAALQAALEQADAGCPFSQLLKRAGAEVSVAARLAGRR